MATIVKRGESYRAQIRQAGKPALSKTFPKKALAQEWVRDTEAGLAADTFRADKTKISDILDDSARTLDLPYEKKKQYRKIDADFGHLQLKDLTAELLIEYARSRATKVKPATIQLTFSYIRTMLRYSENKMGLKPSTNEFTRAMAVLSDGRIISTSDHRDRRVSDAEMIAIAAQQNGDSRFSLTEMMRFAVLTAMRRGEQFELTWDELDIEERTVGIWRKHPKGKKYSRVPLLKEALDIIMRQPKTGGKIFPRNSEHVARTFRACRDLAGVKDLHWHDLRHEGCSRLHEMGLDSMTVAMFSGHRDIQMLARYTHLRANHIVENLKARDL